MGTGDRGGRRRGAVVLLAAAAIALLAWLLLRTGAPAPVPSAGPPAAAPAAARTTADGGARSGEADSVAAGATPGDGTPAAPAEARNEDGVFVLTNVPGARVTVRFRLAGGDPDPEPVEEVADATGQATFPLPVPRWRLVGAAVEARARGHEPARGGTSGNGILMVRLNLALLRGPPVRGKVLGADGHPLAGANVHLEDGTEAETGADGVFEVFGPEGTGRLLVIGERHLPWEGSVTVPAEGVEVHLDRGLQVSGRVAFPDGQPVPGLDVHIENGEAVLTDASGEYVLSGLPPGRVGVSAGLGGERKEVEAGTAGVDFFLREHVVRVRFVDGKGRPYRWAWFREAYWKDGKCVSSVAMPGRVGESGAYACVLEPGETLKICPIEPGCTYAVTTVSGEGPPAFHDVVVPVESPRFSVSLPIRVRTDAGGSPARVRLGLRNEIGVDVLEFAGRNETALGPDGRAIVKDVPAGRWTVEAATGRGFSTPEDYGLPVRLEVAVGENPPELDLKVASGGRMVVTVLSADGTVTGPGEIRLLDGRGGEVEAAFASKADDGWEQPPTRAGPAFHEYPLPPGRYTVQVLRGERVAGTAEVVVPWRQTVEAEVRLPE